MNNINFFSDYYNIICENIFNNLNNNDRVLLVYNNDFNPLDRFNYLIKKKIIKLDILINDDKINNKITENIIGEEFYNNITIYNKLENIDFVSNNYNYIIIFHLESLEYLENLLEIFKNINSNTRIYIYCSLSNENNKKIFYKNYIREKIMQYSKNNMGYVISLLHFLQIIDNNNNLKIYKISIYKKNNYFLYGNNSVYEIILCKK
jgi:GTPase Era involved in 16S rRNA processing